MLNMNCLSKEQQIRVVAALVEGNSLRSTSRMTGVARNTVTTLLLDLAEACAGYHDRYVRNLKVAVCSATKFGILLERRRRIPRQKRRRKDGAILGRGPR
jgi:hypothetical protein